MLYPVLCPSVLFSFVALYFNFFLIYSYIMRPSLIKLKKAIPVIGREGS